MNGATTTTHKSYGCTWNTGELIAGYERDRYSILLCVTARQKTPQKPALLAEITGPSWESVCEEVVEFGFTRPTLTARAVREPQRRAA